MNYLMAWESLRTQALHRHAGMTRSLFDFVIYAGDMLEALPKAYRVDGLGEDGEPSILPQDLLSFVLACVLLTELDAFVSASSGLPGERDEVQRTAIQLWEIVSLAESDPRKRDGLLFTSPTPKAIPKNTDYLRLNGIPPQDEIFGTISG
ncbi:hypothetical protein [Archangium lipolyticum]|uniref:hypothetical protein n=1 Tax=Archangium lipolyticum TaxID=2970465 RepID=UPI00214A0224|nr:hypothetical protein [Archangium lipolyticum]